MLRRPALAALLVLAALSSGGCLGLDKTESFQAQSMGPVQLRMGVCTSSSPGCSAGSNTNHAYALMAPDSALPTQVLVAARLPAGVDVPATMNGVARSTKVLLPFTRNPGFEQQLEQLEPAPAGQRWFGWLSSTVTWKKSTDQGFDLTFSVVPPRPADGAPAPSPMPWRPVVGARTVDVSNLGLQADRPVKCGLANNDLYDGHGEAGLASTTTVCIDSPTPDAARGSVGAPITDFGITGTAASAAPGSTATMVFMARRSGAPDPSTVTTLAAAGGPPGATVALDRTTQPLTGDANQPLLATVHVPADTPAGEYPVTVTATAAGKPARTGTATLRVVAPQAGGTATPPAAAAGSAPPATGAGATAPGTTAVKTPPRDTTAPDLRASLRGGRVRVRLSERATLSVTVERLGGGRRAAVKGRLRRSAPAGASAFAPPKRVAGRRLGRGSYRLVLRASDAAGNRSAARTVRFAIGRR